MCWFLCTRWQQFGGIVYFGPIRSLWWITGGKSHKPLAWAQSADCFILLHIYQLEYYMAANVGYIQDAADRLRWDLGRGAVDWGRRFSRQGGDLQSWVAAVNRTEQSVSTPLQRPGVSISVVFIRVWIQKECRIKVLLMSFWGSLGHRVGLGLSTNFNENTWKQNTYQGQKKGFVIVWHCIYYSQTFDCMNIKYIDSV